MTDQAGAHHVARKERTRAAIIDAAQELFAEVGYDAARTAEIARRAGVSEPTVFRHFETKAGIALAPFDDLVDALLDVMIEGLEQYTPYEILRTMLAEGARNDPEDEAAREAMAHAVAHPELAAHLFWRLNGAIDRLAPAIAARRGVTVDDLDAVVTAHLLVTPTQVSIRRWLESDGALDPFSSILGTVELLRPQLDR